MSWNPKEFAFGRYTTVVALSSTKESISYLQPKENLSIFQISQGWTGKFPNLNDVATELLLPAKLRLVAPEKSAVNDGLGNVHLIITVNPTVKIVKEDGTEAREAAVQPDLLANFMAKCMLLFTSLHGKHGSCR